MAPLSDIRVIEISGSGAAALAGAQFADWGADVTVLEPPGGTPLRSTPPYYEVDGEQRSANWAWLSRGKRTTTVPADAARSLAESADILLLERDMAAPVLGLDPNEVRDWIEGRAICLFITPFALDGPLGAYRATDLGIHARGGWMSRIGYADREPLRPGGDIAPRVTGICGFFAALTALHRLRQGGSPQFIELVEQAVAAALIHASWLVKAMNGTVMGRSEPRFPQAVLECKDGWVGCSPLTTGHWELLCQMMGLDDVLEHPNGRDPAYRAQHADELHERVKPWLAEHTREEIVELGQMWKIPAAPVETVAERLDCPQLAARGFFEQADIEGKSLKVPRVPYLIDGVRPVPRGPVNEQAASPETAAKTIERSAAARSDDRPLSGITILDLTHFWAGPFATMMLGALGATVIKVESIQRPDGYRFSLANMAPERWWDSGAIWVDTNHNKLGVTLDLGSPDGKQLLERLVQQSDIVISNFANRVMPNLGLGADALRKLKDDLIIATLPGYGPGGPWEDYVGFGFPFEQVTGCASITGYAGEMPLQMSGFVDPLAGVRAATALTLALMERERTGKGAVVEVPQCEVVDAIFAPEHIAVQLGASVPERDGNRHAWMAPHNAYRVRGDDQWVTIAVASDEEFRALAAELGMPGVVEDPRFATGAARKANEAELDAVVAEAIRDCDPVAIERQLQAAGVMACRMRQASELDQDEALVAMGFFQHMERPVTGTNAYKTWPFRFSSIDSTHTRPAPLLGEHNREVLGGMLGLSDDEIVRLEEEGVIGTVPVGL